MARLSWTTHGGAWITCLECAHLSPAGDLVGKVAQYSRIYIKLSKTVDLVGRISMSIRRDVGVTTSPRTRKAET